MHSKGQYGYQTHPMIPDPHNAGAMIRPTPPGYWFHFDPHAAKKYQMMMLSTFKIHHIHDIITSNKLMMEQVVNKVGGGYNLSSAVIETLSSIMILQLLEATGLGRYPIWRDIGKLGVENREPNRGLKRSADGRGDRGGTRPPAKCTAAGMQEYHPSKDPCLKYTDGLCIDFNGQGKGCNTQMPAVYARAPTVMVLPRV